jgi:DNA-binding transcriptional MerR regulator
MKNSHSAPEELTIGDLAARSGTTVQTIRYYEQQGLLPVPGRSSGNQRRYTKAHLDRLKFVRHARELGFSIEDIRKLLALAEHPEQPCAQADAIAQAQLFEVERKIIRLEGLRGALKRMVAACKKKQVRSCRIIETLADHDLCESSHKT